MASVTRQLQFEGTVLSTPAAATVAINGTELYSGQIGLGQPLDQIVELLVLEYPGSDINNETLAVTVSVTSGVASFGLVYVDQPTSTTYGPWHFPDDGTDDGRTQILINGLPPDWPATPVDPMPGGTEANPIWIGWNFELSAGETMTFDYDAVAYLP